MAPKILLLNVSPDACFLEREHAAQKFIVATNTVFLKAQGLVMLAPLHKTAFGLLEGLLDNWCLLNLTTIEWLCKAEVHQACVNIWSLNKQAPWAAEFRKMVSAPQNKGKGKAKVTEDDDDDKEATQKLRKELEDFVVPTTFDDKLLASLLLPPSEYFEGDSRLPQGAKILGGQKGNITLVSPATRVLVLEKNGTNGVGIRTQKKHPPLAALVVAKRVKLVQAVKAFFEQQGRLSQFFILEGYKGKGKAKALLEDSEPMGTKRSFKSRKLVDSDSDEEEEEDRVCMIKKIKHEHIEELTGAKRRKEIMELDEEVEIVASKIPVAGPSHPASKPIVLVPSVSKFVPKLIVTLASPVAGPSTVPIVSSSAPTPAKSAGPAVKGGFIFKDPFIVRQFKLVGMEESGALIINQVTEVPVIQGTLHSEESGNEDAEGDDDNSDSGDVTMNVDSAKQPEETQPVAPTKTTVTEVKVPALALVPVLLTKPKRTPFFKLHCTAEHFLYLPLGLQAPIQFEQN
ncbi:hypothetical protein C0995_009846 [Termitomyces sp. Mi166|nr:hypothetical protein C0995_009846 [Termitomyces sp. Mi166\